ncbi:MAG TPA: glycosyltransferase family 39 protein [Dokdonella sp.]
MTTNAAARRRAAVLPALLVVVVVVAVARLLLWAATQPVSFDGAMNLEVARSLAEGDGYRRLYAGHSGFAHEIQTRAPFILPAAAVFALFGVGLWQAQAISLAYALALAAAAFLLVRRWTSPRWGLLGAAACLCAPGIEDIGMNGYGEVPALVWWLGALLALYRPGDVRPLAPRRVFAAGVLVGLAVVTKTVLLIGFVATAPVLLAEQARRARDARAAVATAAALCAGAALPVLLHEAWRALSLGDAPRWIAWLHEEWRSVHMQAGTRRGFSDAPSFAAKLRIHLGVLADGVGLPAWLAAGWLVAALAFVAGVRHRLAGAARPLLSTLLAFAVIYFLWWLGLTPTQKAWYRRIFDGVVVLDLAVALAAALAWRARTRFAVSVRGPLAVAAVLACAGLGAGAAAGLGAANWPHADAARTLERDLALVRALPADAPLYGVGWYSSPVVALYSGRRLRDLKATPPAELAARSPAYLLLDVPARTAGVDAYWRQRYASSDVAASDDLGVLRLDTARSRDPLDASAADPAALRGYVDFASDYAYAFGFHDREGQGWRWAAAESDLVLRYAGERAFAIDVYVPEAYQYTEDHDVGIAVALDGCVLGTLRPASGARSRVSLPLDRCAPPSGRAVHVRLTSDDVLDARDDRQLSFVAYGAGFDAAPAPGR